MEEHVKVIQKDMTDITVIQDITAHVAQDLLDVSVSRVGYGYLATFQNIKSSGKFFKKNEVQYLHHVIISE